MNDTINPLSATYCAIMSLPNGSFALVEIFPRVAANVKGRPCARPALRITLHGDGWSDRAVEVVSRNEKVLNYGDRVEDFLNLGCDVVHAVTPSASRLDPKSARKLFVETFQPKISGYDFSRARVWS